MKSPKRIGELPESQHQKGSRMNHRPSSDLLRSALGWVKEERNVMYQVGLIGLLVEDIDKTIEFYARVFGFRVIQEKSTNPKGDSRAFIKNGDTIFELTQLEAGGAGHPEGAIDHVGFIVDNVEKEIERLKGLGVGLDSPIKGHIPVNRILNVRNGRIFYFRGVNRESIGLIELKKDSSFYT